MVCPPLSNTAAGRCLAEAFRFTCIESDEDQDMLDVSKNENSGDIMSIEQARKAFATNWFKTHEPGWRWVPAAQRFTTEKRILSGPEEEVVFPKRVRRYVPQQNLTDPIHFSLFKAKIINICKTIILIIN